VSHDVIGRLVLMAARSPGLAKVFTCLLGFDGNEFYFKEWPECVGVRFGELSERFPDAIPLGIKRRNGEVLIAPEIDVMLQRGDQIMVLAEDDDTYKACPPVDIDAGELPTVASKAPVSERILMCGWRRDIRDMIQLLDSLVLPGTELHMLCEEPCHLRNKILLESGLNVDTLQNVRIVHHYGNTAIRRHLEPLALDEFTSLMILSDETRESDIMQSDSHTLASLLLVRDLQTKLGIKTGRIVAAEEYCKCICEVLDPRTQRTISTSATILKLSEFIQSNELISCILAMISESRDVRVILDELLGAEGASFEVELSTRYCTSSEHVSFWQLAKRAQRLGEILCGYQLLNAIDETVLNPPHKAKEQSWVGVSFVVLRRKHSAVPIVHKPLSQPIQANDFERTTRSRLGKSTLVRQQILEALVQEQEVAKKDQLSGQDRSLLTRAMQSYVDLVHSERESTAESDATAAPVVDTDHVRSLITVARVLADTLEQSEALSGAPTPVSRHRSVDASDEIVTAFDLNSL
jgi:ion channel POLLUX/CASTOR